MSKFFEVEIGGIVRVDGGPYICVKDDLEKKCLDCAFFGKVCCVDFACQRHYRYDKIGVHFVKKEEDRETKELYTRTLYLKIKSEYFEAVKSGKKTFEVRFDDRGFKVGDKVVLRELAAHDNYKYTGRCIEVEITYILDDAEYCKPGFVVFSFKIVGPKEGGEE